MGFVLNNQLERDSFFVLDLELTQLRLINNSNYPWVILVPRVNNIKEILDLSQSQYLLLNKEIFMVAKIMQQLFIPDKLNLATIGNQVSQFHYHIVVRYKSDSCYPSPVWGKEKAIYELTSAHKIIEKIKQQLNL